MTSSSVPEKENIPLWQYVHVADYKLPSAPVTHNVSKGFSFLRNLFQNNTREQDTPLIADDELKTLPAEQLERIVHVPDWFEAAEALGVELEEWLGQENPDQSVIVLIGPPYHGLAEILTAWAEQREWQVLSPPAPEQILNRDDRWLSGLRKKDTPWVFPVLERAYLRHAKGLSVVRDFLDAVSSGQSGRGIIGCDSWAWAFLQHVWRGRQPTTLTLQAFDQARLSDHFQHLAEAANGRKLQFRQSDNGQYVQPPLDTEVDSGETSKYLQLLAAHSRGIPGVAWAVWRASLQIGPDAEIAGEGEAAEGETQYKTVWVTPWHKLNHPAMPVEAGMIEAFVLHTLLLHNGLSRQILQQVLPLSPNQVMETLCRLEAANLLLRRDTIWQVTPLGYPAVRTFLKTNGYLVDQF